MLNLSMCVQFCFRIPAIRNVNIGVDRAISPASVCDLTSPCPAPQKPRLESPGCSAGRGPLVSHNSLRSSGLIGCSLMEA